jgi:hypothetical protein
MNGRFQMVNKVMFYVGIALIVIAAILLLGKFSGDSTSPIVLGVLGIVFIGASKYRPLRGKKS